MAYGTLKADKITYDNGGTDTDVNVADIVSKANVDGQTFTGNVVLPTTTAAVTQTANDNSTKLATTAYVDQSAFAPLASPTFTGTVAIPNIANVETAISGKAPSASPTFTGQVDITSDQGLFINGDIKIRRDSTANKNYIECTHADEHDLVIEVQDGKSITLQTDDGSSGYETLAKFQGDGAADLYYNGDKKLETTNTGVDVEGTLECNVLQLPVSTGTGYLINLGSASDAKTQIYQTQFDGLVIEDLEDTAGKYSRYQGQELRFGTTDDAELYCTMKKDGAVELYYDGVKKLETTADGVKVTGNAIPDSITALTDAASISVDLGLNNNFSLTLGGNRTLVPTGQHAGQSGSIFITQDGTGSRTLAYHADFKWVGGTAPTLSTAAGAIDRIDYVIAPIGGAMHAVASLDVK